MSFIFYYSVIAGMDLLVILSVQEEVGTFNRTLAFMASIFGVIILMTINYSISLIPKAAHQPYNKLFSIIVKKPTGLALKLKVSGLIEKLSGPTIGFYCFELFPFTNYEFYLYITNCVKNFILFMDLLSK